METVAWNKLRNLFKTEATVSGVECVLPLTCRKIIRLQSLITNIYVIYRPRQVNNIFIFFPTFASLQINLERLSERA